ncbi:AsmA family protein [Marinigracilibium pacificum]|uniref:Uncharacterized protein n=1 Tax=Marinigracilibium pacificum TaxID=2729599 RepID=A0A848J083_9BACT|nr:hypothetical protein [Marinigracilibium pacificum]NMM49061.1 hypothetical protein [Marinigracilibium pacificum]
MSQEKIKHKKPFLRRRGVIIGFALIILFIPFIYITKGLTKSYLHDFLEEKIEEKTNGRYGFSFSEFHINFLASKAEFKDINLQPKDSFQIFNPADTAGLVEIRVPELTLDIKQLILVYWTKKLEVQSIKLDSPEFMIKTAGRNKDASLSGEVGNIYNQISEYLEEFKIDNLNINDASVTYLLVKNNKIWPVVLNGIYLSINDFLLNRQSVTERTKFLSADNVTFYSGQQKVFLNDSIHYISFDSLKLNTLRSEIKIKNFTIQPAEDISHEEVENLVYYNTPGLEIRNINFNRSYQNNILDVGQIKLTETTFNTKNHWVKKMISGQPSKKQDNNFSKFLSSVFNEIEVDTFQMAHGKMIFEQENGAVLHLPKIEINILDYILDSSMISNQNYFPGYTDINVRLLSPNYRSGSKELNFNASLIEFSSNSTILKINKLKITKKAVNNKTPELEAYLPEIIIDGLDKTMLNKDSIVSLKEVYINSPDLFIRSTNVNRDQGRKSILAELPKSWLNAKIEKLGMDNARIEISKRRGQQNPQILTTGLKVEIENMIWDETITLSQSLNNAYIKNISSDHITFSLNNGGIIESNFTVVNNDLRDIFVQNINFQKNPSDSLSSNLSYYGERIRIYRLSKSALINNLKIVADSAVSSKGNLIYHIINSEKNDTLTNRNTVKTLNSIKLKAINLNDTQLDINKDSIFHFTTSGSSIYTTDLNWEKNTDSLILGFDKYRVDFNQLKFAHQGSGHDLTADRVYSNSATDNLIFNNLKIKSTDDQNKKGLKINALIPKLTASANNLSKGLNNKKIAFESLELENPDINIKIDKNNLSKKEAGKLSFSSEKSTIINGNLAIDIIGIKGNNTLISTSSINGNINGLQTLKDSTGIKWPQGGEISILDINFDNKDINMKADSILTGIAPGSLQIIQASATPKDTTQNWQANIDKVSINNWDIPHLLSQKEFIARSVLIDGVTYTKLLGRETNDSEKKNNFLNIKEEANDFLLEKFNALSKIDIGQFSLTRVNFSIADPFQERLAVQGFRFATKDLKANFSNRRNIWDYKGLETGFDYFFYPLASYNIQSGYTIWDDAAQTLSVRDFNIVPTLPPEILAQSQNYEEDIVTLRLGETIIKNFNTLELLNDSTIQADQIIIKNPELNIYRDKNKPVDTNSKKPFPNELVLNSSLGLNINKITTSGGFLRYIEVPENGLLPGDVILTNVNGDITNIYSNPSDSTHLLINMAGNLMGSSKITLDLDFDLNSKEGAFKTTIGLSPMPLTDMNAFLEPSAMIRFNTGQLDTAMVFAQGYTDNIYGNMGFYYEDMSMTLLKVSSDKEGGVKGTLGGFFANMILKKNNTEEWYKKPRYMFYERVEYRSFINFLVKACLTGVKSNMGAGRNLKFIRRFYQDEFKPEIEELKESRLKH